MANSNLTAAKKNKNDEFYTQLTDIEHELKHYVEHFRGKVVYCNCDDPGQSNFWRYFHLNFTYFGLKKLIATHYRIEGGAYTMEYAGGNDRNINEGKVRNLKGTGDFRDEECIEVLKQADIVCTSPPFPLFREYIGQLMEYDKKFVILGNMNAVVYKEIFSLFLENKIWLGVAQMGKEFLFDVPAEYVEQLVKNKKKGMGYRVVNGVVKRRLPSTWFTNLDHGKRHEPLELLEHYSSEKYPKYDNYDAINVDKLYDIPCDYEGVMGVPITFMSKYCPEQFEIIAFGKGEDGKNLVFTKAGEIVKPYHRIFIRRRLCER